MRIAIIGRSEILYDTALKAVEAGHDVGLIVTAKEAPEYKKTHKDFEKLAKQLGAEFINTAKIKDYASKIKPCDIALSMNYPNIIPQDIIDIFPNGILNAHGGDLPRYRGNACQAWAIINGEEKIGLCIHKMIGARLDDGDIIGRDYFPITLDTKIGDVWHWMSDRIPDLFIEACEKLKQDTSYVLEKQSGDPKDALRCYPRKPEDGKIDWNKPNVDILRLINASGAPYSGAFCEFNGQKMIIWEASLAEPENFLAIPGQVTKITSDTIEVATSDGKIALQNVEFKNKRTVPNHFVKSIRERLQ